MPIKCRYTAFPYFYNKELTFLIFILNHCFGDRMKKFQMFGNHYILTHLCDLIIGGRVKKFSWAHVLFFNPGNYLKWSDLRIPACKALQFVKWIHNLDWWLSLFKPIVHSHHRLRNMLQQISISYKGSKQSKINVNSHKLDFWKNLHWFNKNSIQ